MEVKVQKCQHCGAESMRNILLRDEVQKVIVQCNECHQFVARYQLETGGYFHEGKGYESFLRAIERDTGVSSARDITHEFETAQADSEQDFQKVLKHLGS